jgi:hypothetical protein
MYSYVYRAARQGIQRFFSGTLRSAAVSRCGRFQPAQASVQAPMAGATRCGDRH